MTQLVMETPEGHTKGKWPHLQREGALASHHLISTWASSGDNLRPRPGDGMTFNQSGAPGADTTKSLNLTAGGESSLVYGRKYLL